MFPARTLPLKEGSAANLYVWYEYSGYYTAYFLADRVPLLVDSEFLRPGSFYGPFKSHREAEVAGISVLRQLMLSGKIQAGSAA